MTTGMGLFMVRGIIHGRGGHVDVEVVPGVSTSFHLHLHLHLYLPVAGSVTPEK